MNIFSSKFTGRPELVTELPGSVTTPEGFEAAGVAAGIKKSLKPDLGLLLSKKPCVSAAVYTLNAAAAAPVKVCREETETGALQGVVVNSGSANACTGEQGLADARRMVRAAADACGLHAERMAVASTGVIGELLPMDRLEAGINEAAAEISGHGGSDFAVAIQTTDSFAKEGAVKVELSSGTVTIGACAKGAGMIAPDMATMLAFITTDAGVPAGLLQDMLMTAVTRSFNAVSVDGDMSTNDCVFVFANAASGVTLEAGSDDTELFTTALAAVCQGLALKIVADGEGATKVIELKISGAAAPEEAARVARAVADSPLVKTAFYGSDANWGRILASAGAALAGEPVFLPDVYYEGICVAAGGEAAHGAEAGTGLDEIMAQPEISVSLNLNRGEHACTIYFSDLSHEYVTLNAEYTT